MGETEEVSGEYSAKLGFDLYFDFVLDIPEMHQSCQVVYGVYRQGIALLRALKTDAHVVEATPDETKRSLFGEKKNVSGIKVVEEAMLFFELQFTNRVDKFQQACSYGWTALDLFTPDKTLKYASLTRTGRFKLPFYPPPLDVGLSKERISYMLPLPDTYLYVRINHPSFSDEKVDFNTFSDLANQGYTVPLMHDIKEERLGKTDEVDAQARLKELEDEKLELEIIVDNQKKRLEEYINFDQGRFTELFLGQHAIYQRLNKDPFAAPEILPGAQPQPPDNQPQQAGDPQNDENLLDLAKEEKPTKGLKITFLKLEQIVGKKDFKVSMKIFYKADEMKDERDELIDFTTDDIATKAKTDKKAENAEIGVIHKVPYNFQGLNALLKKRKVQGNCYILWQILRVLPPHPGQRARSLDHLPPQQALQGPHRRAQRKALRATGWRASHGRERPQEQEREEEDALPLQNRRSHLQQRQHRSLPRRGRQAKKRNQTQRRQETQRRQVASPDPESSSSKRTQA